jgi:hypothetical protein
MMSERRSETYCKAAFNKYLQENHPQHEFSWRKLPQEDEPPDYEITIDEKLILGVEVTQTKLFAKTVFDQETINLLDFRNSKRKFVKKLEQEFLQAKAINGKYMVYFDKPILKNDYQRLLKYLAGEIKEYLHLTRDIDNSTELHEIMIDNILVCRIRKWHSRSSGLITQFAARASFVHSRKNIDLVKSMLQKAIDEKTCKLKKVNYSKPCILLILDTYLLTDKELYLAVASEIKGLDYFHSVYVIADGGDVTPLRPTQLI